jgi:hypothetical protein
MRTGKKARGGATQTAEYKPKPGGKAASGSSNSRQSQQTKSPSGPPVTLSHEQIAQRAVHIWRQEGCLPGRDEQNWQKAEAQLKAELGVS